MSDILVAAVLSLVAAAILAPFANHFFTRYRERRSIVATLRVHEAPIPTLLRSHFQEFRSRIFDPIPSAFNSRQLDVLYFMKGYMSLTLLNPGKKKLNAVTVTFGEYLTELVCQIDDGPELFGPAERKIVIGDLQPGKTTTLHIWTQFAYVDWDSSRLPILFSVAADEFDKFTLKFPSPGYLRSALIWRLGWYTAYLTAIIALSVVLLELGRWLVRLKT